ncbi:glycosyltransferase family 4 protein [Cupriavidus agavae]|uniref:Glycosyltransferase involved in cell wall biosynthesis n=1 Tax=Cupriavidus agavae TaxID=1001822 RepID=A0A4Q7S6M1_9BURK|nr:glycosyltransferase family 4 protein [Cupriavidus agavae]RZT41358.1 glycosyltransferase involved in cell wall biosynthesis [Cupriavidus agavae]
MSAGLPWIDPPLPLPTLPHRPRIAYLITNSEIGGAQTHVAHLLRAMRERADVMLLAGGDGPLFALAGDLGIPAVRLAQMDNALSPLRAVHALRELTAALRGAAPDVIHTHSAKASALGRIAGRILNLPVVYTVHGFAFKPAAPWKRRAVGRLVEWALAPLTAQMICVAGAERAMAQALPIPASRISVIPNGIADAPRAASPAGPLRRIVTVMRLAQPKRPDIVIRAFAKALPEGELVIAGDGPQRDSLTQLAAQLAPGRVRFAGNVDDIAALLATAQAFVLASDHEGLPISILEAMRAGLPIVASDLPGIREQLEDGRSGVLVPGNDPTAFAASIDRLASDAPHRIALGDAARARWQQAYGLEPMIQATWAVYQRVLAGSRPLAVRASAS